MATERGAKEKRQERAVRAVGSKREQLERKGCKREQQVLWAARED